MPPVTIEAAVLSLSTGRQLMVDRGMITASHAQMDSFQSQEALDFLLPDELCRTAAVADCR